METPTVAEHTRLDTITLISGISKALKFCYGRAKLEHYSIILNKNRSEIEAFPTMLEPEKYQLFDIFHCVPPKPVTHQSPDPSAPSGKRKKIENKHTQKRNGSKTTPKTRRDDNEQVKHDLIVLFSSIFILRMDYLCSTLK